MSDLIKKIKIKKQDGTYTDYIPIGAEAKNIDCSDGESVENKLNKKPYCYNTVADMKADTKLKAGDMAITLGYYEANDGGGAEYRIINSESQNEYQEELNNNLYATLVIKDIVNVKQFGAYGDGVHNDTIAIQKACNYNNIQFNADSIFSINDSIPIHSNIKILGCPTTKLIINSSFDVFVGEGESESVSITEYNITTDFIPNTWYGFTIDGINYEFYNTMQFNSMTFTFLINTLKKVLIIINDSSLREDEYKLYTTNAFKEGTIILTLGTVISTETQTTPKTYIENVIIDGLNLENSSTTRGNNKLIKINNCKNSYFCNNKTKNLGLCRINLTNTATSASLDRDNYIYRGMNQKILNDNIVIENNTIIGLEEQDVSNLTNSDGIYIQYAKNCKIINNTIKYMLHGVSLWGGNVGNSFLWAKDFLNFMVNIDVSNNYIHYIRNGGVWTSRTQDIRVDNNYISVCGDVNIDFEGSKGCIASNNTCYDSRNGALATLYNSYDINFVNNYCEDTGYFPDGRLVLNHTSRTSYQQINFIGNKFVCKNKQIKIYHQSPGSKNNSNIVYENNNFTNVSLVRVALESPKLIISNNTFELTEAALNTKYDIIEIATSNCGSTDAIITNNYFCVPKGTSAAAGYLMNSNYSNIYAINYWKGVWTGRNNIVIKDNIIEFMPNAIKMEKTLTNDNGAKMYMHLINNEISGSVDNYSVKEGAYIYYENNKTPRLNKNNYTDGSLMVFPSSIPTQDETYFNGYLKNTVIHFDEPDIDGYTMALCIATGIPGTWKRMGKVETEE